jgi:hypothetical protein
MTSASGYGPPRADDYPQLPVLQGTAVVDLLTCDAVSRWMTAELQAQGQIPLKTMVRDVTTFDEDRTYELVDRSATVLTALGLFARHQRRGAMLHAILVAKRLPAGLVVAIATATDLPAIFAAAEPFRWRRSGFETEGGAGGS